MPSLRIEFKGYTDQKGEELARSGASSSPTSEVNVDNSLPGENEAPHLPVKDQETGEVESIDTLKQRLKLAEQNCARLEELYQTYRLRWLEENYQASVLEVYAPAGIDTCSLRQLAWNAPSPIQSKGEVE
ncbi:uncharacterized protein HD556DRAFT_1310129 [Suillus plorans]|uniref:Uncharacterized protein n=1 Tax=Suillus plorans TaxID=116603 RepID=A0A9P7AK84_9AGAM|nr:uncharacterized protein HD556DRAFT_1310129 [Suillus plorans]KAG1791015.1 hypothetical protein HD556DRAFT_1310129 [Suillus plorans]